MKTSVICLSLAAVLLAASSVQAQSVSGSLAAELDIDGGATVAAALSGTAGAGIPLPSLALGIAPGEPTLMVNTDLNVVAIAGGAIEEATGGVVSSGAAQNVIRTGISGGDVAQVIANEAAGFVAQSVEESSGGFIPAASTRAVLAAAINGDSVSDALEEAIFDVVVEEGVRLLAGEVGRAVQEASGGFVDGDIVEDFFNDAANGGVGDAFLDALRAQFGRRLDTLQGNGNNNPVLIANVASPAQIVNAAVGAQPP